MVISRIVVISNFGHAILNPSLVSERSDKDGEAGDPVVPVHDLGELGGGDACRKYACIVSRVNQKQLIK